MTTPITSATTGTTGTTDKAASNALGQLDSNAFLKLLVAQMRYQNPFSPSDPSAMLGQVATYAQVESLQKIQAGQTSNATLEQARMAGEVIGRKVTGTDSVGAPTTGIVASARFTASGPVLVLDSGKEMALAAVETIAAATTGSTAAATTGASTSVSSVAAASRASTSGQTATGSGTSSPSTATASAIATAAAARIVRAAIGAYDGAIAPSSAALTGRAA